MCDNRCPTKKFLQLYHGGGIVKHFFAVIKYCKNNENNIDIVKNNKGDICGQF